MSSLLGCQLWGGPGPCDRRDWFGRHTLVRVDSYGLEHEVKLEAGIGFRTPDLAGLAAGVTVRGQPEQHLQAIYVDTADLRLARSGITLRHRSERLQSRPPGEWTLKLPEDSLGSGVTRRELNWAGKSGQVPDEIAGLVRAYRRTAALAPVARLVTHRRRTLLCGRNGDPLLEIDDDVVSVMDGRRLAARFREVEVEVVGSAPTGLLDRVVGRLWEAGALPGDGRSKLARAIGYRATEPPDVSPAAVTSDASMADAIRAAIVNGYVRLVAHDLGVRLDEDPEDVHQARVATRRLRSDLRTFAPFLPDDWSASIRSELGWLAEALGRARDADVLLERLRHQIELLEPRDVRPAGALVAKLVGERDEARIHLLDAMNTDRYGELLDRLVSATRELPPVPALPHLVPAVSPVAATETGAQVVVLPVEEAVDPPAARVAEQTGSAVSPAPLSGPGAVVVPLAPPSSGPSFAPSGPTPQSPHWIAMLPADPRRRGSYPNRGGT